MSNRKYNINKKPLTNEEIDNYKDFDSLMNKFPDPGDGNSTPNVKSYIKYVKGSILGIVGAVVAWFAVQQFTKPDAVAVDDTATIETGVQKYTIAPHITGADVPFQSFEIDAQRDVELTTDLGSIISIKANSFMDDDGNLVKGKVEILFREFHNPIDVFASGIPMQYDSGATNYTFESAGMFELKAMQNGVALARELVKDIVVDLVSENGGSQFNNYYFDTASGAWQYLSRSEVDSVPQAKIPALEVSKITKQKSAPKTESHAGGQGSKPVLAKPTKPIPVKYPEVLSDKYAFTIDYSSVQFPELAKGLVFQVDHKLSKFSPAYYDVNWDQIELVKSTHKDRYTVNLTKGSKNLSVECYPALSKEEYTRLQNQYKEAVASYDALLIAYNQSQGQTTYVNQAPKESEFNKSLRNDVFNLAKTKVTSARRFRRRFRIRYQGVTNSDHPRPTISLQRTYYGEYAPRVIASFTDGRKHIKALRIVSVVGGFNILLSEQKKVNEVAYSKKDKNLLWVLHGEEEIAIADPDNFENIKGDRHRFTMTTYKGIEGVQKLRELYLEQ